MDATNRLNLPLQKTDKKESKQVIAQRQSHEADAVEGLSIASESMNELGSIAHKVMPGVPALGYENSATISFATATQ